MDIVINLEPLIQFFNLPADIMFWRAMVLFGWMPIAIGFLYGTLLVWLKYKRTIWIGKQKFVLLAIDIPRGNEQSPKAVENIFTYLAGGHKPPNLFEKYFLGEFQLSFSFEIISIEGYTQFVIHVPVPYRNLLESGIYSQYPDAEITEIDDYTKGMPTHFPNDEYDLFGFEAVLQKNSVYPIKTYADFMEKDMGKPEDKYKDTMSSLMDLCSSLKRGEQLWAQLIIVPIDFGWEAAGDEEIKKIAGIKPKETWLDEGIGKMIKWMGDFSEAIYELWGDVPEKKEEKNTFNMMNLTPKQKNQIEGIQRKCDKLGFEFKYRFIYLAKKEVMNKPKVGYGFTGYIKQFLTQDSNGLKPDYLSTGISAHYLARDARLSARKTNLIQNYINRDDWAGRDRGILNIEELATLWHFPVESAVKAPLIQKAPGRKAEPPMTLPIADVSATRLEADPLFLEKESDSRQISAVADLRTEAGKNIRKDDIFNEADEDRHQGEPPSNLPFA